MRLWLLKYSLCWLLVAATCRGQDGDLTSAFSSSRYPGFTLSGAPASGGGHQGIEGVFQAERFLTSNAVYAHSTADGMAQCPDPLCQPVTCESCCSSPCDECNRNVAIDISTVFMNRGRPRSQPLFSSPTNATEQINAAAFDFGTAPGIEAGIISYDFLPKTDLELRATWVDDWSDRMNRTFNGSSVEISTTPPLVTSGPRDGFTIYDSRFLSTELNARYRLSANRRNLTLVLGLRAIRLDERLNATLSDPSASLPDEIVQTKTNNRLVGLQFGADHVFANRSNCCVKVTGRVGLYGNDGHQQTRLISLATPPVTFPADGSEGNLAFHAELGVTGKLRLTKCANLVVSYRATFIDGIALASEQLAANNFLTGSGYDSNGFVMLYTANVGIELVY